MGNDLLVDDPDFIQEAFVPRFHKLLLFVLQAFLCKLNVSKCFGVTSYLIEFQLASIDMAVDEAALQELVVDIRILQRLKIVE